MPPADFRTVFRLIAAFWCSFALLACEKSGEDGPEEHSAASAKIRIVSLSPALTRIAVDLGLKASIVGRTQFCTAVDESVPVVGDHFAQDLEMLVRLRPTHVLLQPPRNEVPAGLHELAEQHRWQLLAWRIDTIEDVRAIVRDMPALIFPVDENERAQLEVRAAEVLGQVASALDSSTQGRGGKKQMRVLLVYSTEPAISVFGSETYLDEVLRAFGCANAAEHVSGWGQISLEDVVRIDPDAIILLVRQGVKGENALGPLAELPLRAIAEDRVAALDHPGALLPSTSLIEVAGEMRAILDSFAGQRP